MPPAGCKPALGAEKEHSRKRVLLPVTKSKSNWIEVLNIRLQNIILVEESMPEISQNHRMSKRFWTIPQATNQF